MSQENIFSRHQAMKTEHEARIQEAESTFLDARAEKIISTFHDELDLFYAYLHSTGFPLATEITLENTRYLSYELHHIFCGNDPDSSDYSISYSNLACVLLIDEQGMLKFMRLNDSGGLYSNNSPRKTPDPLYIPLYIPETIVDYKKDQTERDKYREKIMKSGYTSSNSGMINQYPDDIQILGILSTIHVITKKVEQFIEGSLTEQQARWTGANYYYQTLQKLMFPDGFTFQEHQANTQRKIAKQSLQNSI